MMRAYAIHDRSLVEVPGTDPSDLEGAVWVDLSAPSADEQGAVVEQFGQILPEDAAAGEIEATSRYYEDEDSIQVQLNFLDHTGERVKNMNVAFAWRQGPLMSLHDRELIATEMFRQRAAAQPELAEDGMTVFKK